MPEEKKKKIYEQIAEIYSAMVQQNFPEHYRLWPIVSGYDLKHGTYKGWLILIFLNSGRIGIQHINSFGELHSTLIGVKTLDRTNKNVARTALQRYFSLRPTDAIVFADEEGVKEDEFQLMLQKHGSTENLVGKQHNSSKIVHKASLREWELKLVGAKMPCGQLLLPLAHFFTHSMLVSHAGFC